MTKWWERFLYDQDFFEGVMHALWQLAKSAGLCGLFLVGRAFESGLIPTGVAGAGREIGPLISGLIALHPLTQIAAKMPGKGGSA